MFVCSGSSITKSLIFFLFIVKDLLKTNSTCSLNIFKCHEVQFKAGLILYPHTKKLTAKFTVCSMLKAVSSLFNVYDITSTPVDLKLCTHKSPHIKRYIRKRGKVRQQQEEGKSNQKVSRGIVSLHLVMSQRVTQLVIHCVIS